MYVKTSTLAEELSVLWGADQGSINDHDSSLKVAIAEQRFMQRQNFMRLLLKRAPCRQLTSATLQSSYEAAAASLCFTVAYQVLQRLAHCWHDHLATYEPT